MSPRYPDGPDEQRAGWGDDMRSAMKGMAAILSAMAVFTALPGQAKAGLYQDDLSRCLISAATPQDRDMLLRWVFAAMAANPRIADMARVSKEQSEELTKGTAQLMQRLVLTDCRKQTVEAVKYEGEGTIQSSFSTLGQIAMADLMRDEHTGVYIATLDQYIDREKWTGLMSEVGIKAQRPAP